MQRAHKPRAETAIYTVLLSAIVFIYTLIASKIASRYHPVWSDEFLYFINAASLAENHTLQAALTFNGRGSELLGADSHGPGYPLLHGAIAMLFGRNTRNIILFNLVAILSTVGIILSANFVMKQDKLKIVCLLLLSPLIPLYAVTYMQEMVHLPIAVILSIIMWRIYNEEVNTRYIVLFIVLVSLAALFRGLWFFWLIGLIPAAKSRMQRIGFLLIFLAGALGSFYASKLFNEAFPNTLSYFLSLWHNGHRWSAFILLLEHSLLNIKLYFFSSRPELCYAFMKVCIIALSGFFVVRAYIYRGRLDAALASIATVNLLLLLVAYDAHSWREVRTMAPLFYFLLPYFILQTRAVIHFLAAGASFIVLLLTLPMINQWVFERNVDGLPSMAEQSAFQELRRVVPDNKIILVDYFPLDNSRDLLNLPLRNSRGGQMRYIIKYYAVPIVRYDYVLCRPQQLDLRPAIINNKYFRLLENK